MRILIFILVIVGLGYYAKKAFSEGNSPLSSFVGAKMKDVNPLHISPPKSLDSSLLIPSPSISTVTPQLVPPSYPPRPEHIEKPAEPPFFTTYRFKYRNPPLETELGSFSQLGVQIYIDRSTRSVFLRGSKVDVESIRDFFSCLDTVQGSCSVRTWAVFVDDSMATGWDLTAAISAVTNPKSSLTVGDGKAILDIGVGDLAAALDVMCDSGGVRVLQRPHISLLDGVEATIESTREIPIPSVTLSNGFSQSSVSYRKVGLQLHVTPVFLSSDRLRLSVRQENGLVGADVEVSGVKVPTIDTQTVQTSVELTVGQAVVLGGVATDRIEIQKGLLKDTEVRRRGALYIVLGTYTEVPRAYPVTEDLLPGYPSVSIPFSQPSVQSFDFLGSGVLPSKSWRQQESDFIRVKSVK